MSENADPILVIASDTIGPEMAGSGIRYWHFAREIGRRQPVTLTTPSPVALPAPDSVTIVPYGDEHSTVDRQNQKIAALISEHKTIVAQHLPYLYTAPELLADRNLVIDLYAPWILEKLEYARIDPERGESDRADDVEILNRLLSLGDFFLCASERQRDFWLGALAAAGRLDLAYSKHDPELRNLIDVVPFGLPEANPLPSGSGPRDVFQPIGREDPVLLWNGGLWNWLDPLTAIRATGILAQDIPSIRLVFMGTKSPGAQVAEMEMVETARQLASELALLDKHVFFHDWVPYDERQTWLLQANATVSLHYPTVEARFAFRTRMLDTIWCKTPVIATTGDVFADLIESSNIGVTVAPGDAVAVAEAVQSVLDPATGRQIRQNLATINREHTWQEVTKPLVRYCSDPRQYAGSRPALAADQYLHKLELLYTETRQYAQDLEQVVAEKNAALERGRAEQHPGRFNRLFGKRTGM